MLFNGENSKIKRMQKRQEGMASIVVVSILVIIMTLISIGFARLMNRNLTNSANRQFSSAATYAAQSAINDVSAYLKQYVTSRPAGSPQPKSDKCNGPNSLIGGNGAPPGPFYDDSNLANDSARSTSYTCLILDPTPKDLVYQQIQSNKSQIVKISTSAFPGSLDKLLISWQASNPTLASYPPGCPVSAGACTSAVLSDETTWNSNSYIPMLRLTIYPIPSTGNLANIQANSKTVFLYPQSPSGNVPVRDYRTLTDGAIVPIPCVNTIGVTSGLLDFVGTADYSCNLILNSLASFFTAPTQIGDVYLRLTPIYNQADVKIKANDRFGQQLNFINVQALVDATAKSGGTSKRLQARIDTTSLSASGSGVDFNIASSSDSIPEQSVRSANALCKRIVQTVSFFSYVSFDTPPSVCHDVGAGSTSNPIPHLALSITGQDWNGSSYVPNVTRDSQDNTPNPSQKGTIYIPAGGNARLDWTTTDATSCIASGGSPGWAGEKSGIMTFSGTPPATINGVGSQSFGGITDVTNYTLLCSRVGGGSTPYTTINDAEGPLTVTAWPPPRVSVFGPGSIEAGGPYTVNWSSANTTRCVLSGDWNDTTQTGISGSETMTWPVMDNSSVRNFTATCYDPIGRSSSQTVQVGPGIPDGGGGPGGGINVYPPTCTTNVSLTGINPSTSTTSWTTQCDYWDAANTWWVSRHIEYTKDGSSLWSGDASCGWMGCSGSFANNSPGTYCFQIYVWADYWQSKASAASFGGTTGPGMANSGSQCITVYPPLTITNFSNAGVWDQGPECSYPNPLSPYHMYDKTWWCRAGRFPTGDPNPGCADGVHRWTTCWVSWSTNGGFGTVNCQASVIGYGQFDSSSWAAGGINSHSSGPWGWINAWLVTGYMYLDCQDSAGQTAQWGPI